MGVPTNKIRNVALISHSGAGKTTMVENLLFSGGAISKKGSVDEGTSVSDFHEDEKDRKNSIDLSVSFYEHGGVKVNLLDTPGYLDYIGEVVAGLYAADSAITVIDAVGGVEVGTNKFWNLAKERGLPGFVVINKMDKDNADFEKVLGDIQKFLGRNCVALFYPAGKGPSFTGMANLLTKEGLDKLQGEDREKAQALSDELTEGVAESDDALLEKYLEEGELSADELKTAFRRGVVSGKIIPVMPAAIEKGVGTDQIMSMIADYMPSPADRPACEALLKEGEAEAQVVSVESKQEAPFASQIFKTISDPYAGQISIFRVISGTIACNSGVLNSSKGSGEKMSQLFYIKGKEQIQTESVVAGDIASVNKLKKASTGDSMVSSDRAIKFRPIKFPEPALSFSIKPKSRSDEDKISDVLSKLSAENPVFKSNLDKQTNELIASGMGDMHLKTMVNRMKDRYGVEVEIGTPKVAYKETITAGSDTKYRHKKQSGGAGQFAEVWMRVEPLDRGEGFEFVDEVVGGAIPQQFIGSCEKGIKNAMGEGVIAHFPVTDVKAVVYDGKTHPVDSKDIAFQIAAAHAFREACQKAKPVLLEPVMEVELTIPEENMGDVTGSLSSRRGRVQGMVPQGGLQVVKALMPLEEMYKYANELKSLTAGRATYTMSFSHYEPVPSNIAQTIIEKNKKQQEQGE